MEEAKALDSARLEDRHSLWRRHMAQVEEGQISVRQYCLDHGLSQSGFYYWRRRLQGQKKSKRSSDSRGFSRVEVSGVSFSSPIRLALGEGVVLFFDQEPRPSWVKELMRVLGDRS